MTAAALRVRPARRRTAAAVSTAGLFLVAACATGGTTDDDGAPGVTPGDPTGPVATRAAVATTAHQALRDGDVTDVAVLSEQMAAVASGDPQWVAVMADLRSRSWLAARYPGRYELTDIYTEAWTADNAAPLERESLELGLYIDEPLPLLESVVLTRERGRIVELEVVIRSQEAVVRTADGDAAVTTLPGGRRRGLFSLGPATPDDTDRPWRIHSIAEMTPPADSTAATSPEAEE